MLKPKLRKKILKIREKINKNNIQIDFNQIMKILKKEKIDKKEEEMKLLSQDHEDFKKEIEKNKEDYEKIIEEAADEIESFVEKANLENPVQ